MQINLKKILDDSGDRLQSRTFECPPIHSDSYVGNGAPTVGSSLPDCEYAKFRPLEADRRPPPRALSPPYATNHKKVNEFNKELDRELPGVPRKYSLYSPFHFFSRHSRSYLDTV